VREWEVVVVVCRVEPAGDGGDIVQVQKEAASHARLGHQAAVAPVNLEDVDNFTIATVVYNVKELNRWWGEGVPALLGTVVWRRIANAGVQWYAVRLEITGTKDQGTWFVVWETNASFRGLWGWIEYKYWALWLCVHRSETHVWKGIVAPPWSIASWKKDSTIYDEVEILRSCNIFRGTFEDTGLRHDVNQSFEFSCLNIPDQNISVCKHEHANMNKQNKPTVYIRSKTMAENMLARTASHRETALLIAAIMLKK
jgi:hypothetical protein